MLAGLDEVVRVRIGAPAEAAAGVQHVELHLLGLQAQHAATVAWSTVWNCSPFQTSHASAREPAPRSSSAPSPRARDTETRTPPRASSPRRRALSSASPSLRADSPGFARAPCTAAMISAEPSLNAPRLVPLDRRAHRGPSSPTRSPAPAPPRRCGICTTSTTPVHRLRLRRVERFHLGAEARRMRDHRGQHARQLHVLREHARCRWSWRGCRCAARACRCRRSPSGP